MKGDDLTYIIVVINAIVGALAIILSTAAAWLLYTVNKRLERIAMMTEALVRQNQSHSIPPKEEEEGGA